MDCPTALRDSAADENIVSGLTRTTVNERRMADAVRALAAEIQQTDPPLDNACLGPVLADVAAVLWARVMKFDVADPLWPDRDRFVLPAGSGGLLPALLHLTGHATPVETPEASVPEGQGIAFGFGFALAERLLAARFGKSLVDHRTWVLAGEDELASGLAHEAISLAGQLRLEKLVVLCAEARLEEDVCRRFAACQWAVKRIGASDLMEITAALSAALRSKKPTLILCCAAPEIAGHSDDQADSGRLWRAAGSRGSRNRRAWLKRLARHPLRGEFERMQAGRLPDCWPDTLAQLKAQIAESSSVSSTAKIVRQSMDGLVPALPDLAVGTTLSGIGFDAGAGCAARFLEYGPRILALGAAVGGMALHGGLHPLGVADAQAGEWLRPVLRFLVSAGKRVAVLLADSSRGVAESVASLRSVSGLLLMRPADGVEALECLELALRRGDGPVALVLSGAATPLLRGDVVENRCARGGYVLAEADGPRRATLIAAGPELQAALEARTMLAGEGIAVAVVSFPCWELFAWQDQVWRDGVLGSAPRFGIEAGNGAGWDRWLGETGYFIGPRLPKDSEGRYPHNQLTPEIIAGAVRKRLLQGEDGS